MKTTKVLPFPISTLRDELPPLEQERVFLLVLGWDFRDIAAYCGVSIHTLKNQFSAIYAKTGTADKLELAIRYVHEEFKLPTGA